MVATVLVKSTIRNMDRKVVGVTGATGFIGGAICVELKKRGYTVIGIDLVKRQHLIPYMDKFFQEDFINIATSYIHESWVKCDAIIHCAGASLVAPSIMKPCLLYTSDAADE